MIKYSQSMTPVAGMVSTAPIQNVHRLHKPRLTIADLERPNAITHAAMPLAPDQKRVYVNIETVGRVLKKSAFNKPPRDANKRPLSRDFRVVQHFSSAPNQEQEKREVVIGSATAEDPSNHQSDSRPPKRLPTVEEVERSNDRFQSVVAKPGQHRTSFEIKTADGGSMQYLHYRPLDRTDGTLLHNQRQMVNHSNGGLHQLQKGRAEPTPVEVIAPESEFQYRTGQEWLEAAAKLLHKYVFIRAGYVMPNMVAMIWFPSNNPESQGSQTLGQCWPSLSPASDIDVKFICISPMLVADVERIDTLAHEMVHAIDDCQSGHRGNFVKICKAIGLTEGTPSSASAGVPLMHIIEQISREIGPCPFPVVDIKPRVRKPAKPTHKLECPQCQFTCRASEGNAQLGLPTCACGTKLIDLSADVCVRA